jgi:hypothetical protein
MPLKLSVIASSFLSCPCGCDLHHSLGNAGDFGDELLAAGEDGCARGDSHTILPLGEPAVPTDRGPTGML